MSRAAPPDLAGEPFTGNVSGRLLRVVLAALLAASAILLAG